jgi:thymidylate kinase
MNANPLRHVVFEGLPAVGKSETLALLARFYPQRVRILPELVKEVVEQERIDLFRERKRLAEAILAAAPARRDRVSEIIAEGRLCLEESHLGVHLAYARALDDPHFPAAYERARKLLLAPDLFVRLDLPIVESLDRQRARGTPAFEVSAPVLERMARELDAWHCANDTALAVIDADRSAGAVLAEVETRLSLQYERDPRVYAGTFDVLFLLGRPASGKSEFIDFMTRLPVDRRARRYHLAPLEILDDFPILWQKFEEDDAWEQLGRDRLYSRPADGNYAVTNPDLWGFLIRRLDREIVSRLSGLGRKTLLVEFSRGGQDAYRAALEAFSPSVLSRAAILYVEVSAAESRRRNLARYDAAQRDGILTHSVPRAEMEGTYAADDWRVITGDTKGTVTVRGVRVPYVTMCNEPESTDPDVLDPRYSAALDALHAVWSSR